MDKLKNLPENCEFPQLREIVNTTRLAQTLQRYLEPSFASDELQVEDCEIEQLDYKPGASHCRIIFTANIRRRTNHELGQQIYFGQLSRFRSTKVAFDFVKDRNLAQPKFGPAMIHIPEWEMMLWAYPNDPNLPGLAMMADPQKVMAYMSAAPEKFGLVNQQVENIAAEITKYVPGRRCGFIYRMTLAASNSRGDKSWYAVYGKAYRGSEGEKAYAIIEQIWESEACQQGNLLMPQPYSFDAANGIIWQEAISGQPFAKIAATIPNLPEVAQEIGVRLAALHNLRLDLPQEKTFNFQAEDVRHAVKAINKTFPQFGASCAAIGQKLLDAAARLGPGPVTPIHASFKFSHIFAAEKGITFIDFDGATLGDPGYDLGRFIAHLKRMEVDGKLAFELGEQTIRNFCESYNRAAVSPMPQERIAWFTASHLVSSEIYKSVKRVKPDLVSSLLKYADRLCPE